MKTTITLTLTLLGSITGFGMVSASPSPSLAASPIAATTTEDPEAGQLIISTFLLVCESEVPEPYRACGQATVAGPFATSTSAREFREEFGLKCEIQGQRTDEATYCWDGALVKKGDTWVR